MSRPTECPKTSFPPHPLFSKGLLRWAVLVLAAAAALIPLLQRLVPLGGPGNPNAPPPDATVLFAGSDLQGWVAKDGGSPSWNVRDGYLEVVPGNGDIQTRQVFGDCRLHVEFWVPLMADKAGQARGNSGIFLQGRYEVQVLDSWGNDTYPDGACAALYGIVAPTVNASRPPEQWQTYDLTFRSPRVDAAGRVTTPGRLSVVHNGVRVIDNAGFDRPTGSARGARQGPWGPIRLQDHGAAVRYRNVWLQPLPEPAADLVAR